MLHGTRSSSASEAIAIKRPAFFRRARLFPWLALLPVLLYLGVLYVDPLLRILWQSLADANGLTLQYYARLGSTPTYARVFRFTVELGLGVTFITLLIGYPFAYALTRCPPRLLPIAFACVLMPFWTSVIVRTFTWMVLLERNGVVNQALITLGLVDAPLRLLHTKIAVYIGLVHYVLPFMIVSLYGYLKRIDPTYLRAAGVLGARPSQAFLRVYLPLSMPGVASSCILAFVLTVGFYITPAILGGLRSTTVPILIEQQVATDNWHFASAMAVVLLAIALVLNHLAERLGSGRQMVRGS